MFKPSIAIRDPVETLSMNLNRELAASIREYLAD
jgi:hypothetical protein